MAVRQQVGSCCRIAVPGVEFDTGRISMLPRRKSRNGSTTGRTFSSSSHAPSAWKRRGPARRCDNRSDRLARYKKRRFDSRSDLLELFPRAERLEEMWTCEAVRLHGKAEAEMEPDSVWVSRGYLRGRTDDWEWPTFGILVPTPAPPPYDEGGDSWQYHREGSGRRIDIWSVLLYPSRRELWGGSASGRTFTSPFSLLG